MYSINQQPNFEPNSTAPYPEAPHAPSDFPAHVPQTSSFAYYQLPPPPRFVGTRIRADQILNEVHRLPLHFFELYNGELICRHGPCLTCYPNFYAARVNARRGFPNTDVQSQPFDQAWRNDYTQPPVPSVPLPRTNPVPAPVASENNFYAAQSAQPLQSMGTVNEPVNQEVLQKEGPALLPPCNAPVRAFKAGEEPKGEYDTRLQDSTKNAIRNEAVQRVHQWRTQVRPTRTFEQNQSEEIGATQNDLVNADKRKADPGDFEAISAADERRLRTETEGGVVAATGPRRRRARVVRNDKNRPCKNCRRCHKVRLFRLAFIDELS
ncbi:hypothetical protein ACEPAF_821 [Sanghuangporus sanghuang]